MVWNLKLVGEVTGLTYNGSGVALGHSVGVMEAMGVTEAIDSTGIEGLGLRRASISSVPESNSCPAFIARAAISGWRKRT